MTTTTIRTGETPATGRSSMRLPGLLLRAEGIAVLAGTIAAYAHLGGSGWLFLLLLLVPDLGMVGYLRDARTGAMTYNLVHNYVLPGLLLAGSLAAEIETGVMVALVWLAHIGMDRAVGYGLKYTTAFKDTHLNRV